MNLFDIDGEPFWWNVKPYLRVCVYRYTFPVPHGYQEYRHQQCKFLPRLESHLWRQYVTSLFSGYL